MMSAQKGVERGQNDKVVGKKFTAVTYLLSQLSQFKDLGKVMWRARLRRGRCKFQAFRPCSELI